MADSRESTPASSQLSSHGSSEFAEDVKMEDGEPNIDTLPSHETHLIPPAKRRRTGQFSHQSTPAPHVDPVEPLGDISSDTDGSIPSSPSGERFQMPDEDPLAHEQVTACKWQDCPGGELGNMDKLVQHLHDDHIGSKQTSYACEWLGCARKGLPHASGYALKAHMRSHTKEKPFYCALPECDRSFTRSDALAKHMRTVHETEALRPSDPVPRNYSSAHFKPQKLRLIINAKPPEASDRDAEMDDEATIYDGSDGEGGDIAIAPFEYPSDLHFTEVELAMPPDQLYKFLRRQLHWAEEEGAEVQSEVKALEREKREEWMGKELVLTNLMEAELAAAHGRGFDPIIIEKHMQDLPPAPLQLSGPGTPWYRKFDEALGDGQQA